MSSRERCLTPKPRKRTAASDRTATSTRAYSPRRIKAGPLLAGLRRLAAARLRLVLRRALGLQLLRADRRGGRREGAGHHDIDVGSEGLGHLPRVLDLHGRVLAG